MNNYILAINRDGYTEVLDARDSIDTLNYIGWVDLSWKKIFYKKHLKPEPYEEMDCGLKMYTYSKGRTEVLDDTKGDYIPPGALYESRLLDRIISYGMINRIAAASNWAPLKGKILLNNRLATYNSLTTGCRRVRLSPAGTPYDNPVRCWKIKSDAADIVDSSIVSISEASKVRPVIEVGEDSGVRAVNCRTVTVSQVISLKYIVGLSMLRVRCEGAISMKLNDQDMVLVDDIWVWEGQPIHNQMRLSITGGEEHFIRNVEVLND